VPISGDYDPFNLDAPQYVDKIPPEEREYLENPENYFLPLFSERQTEIVEEDPNPENYPVIKYNGKIGSLFTRWVKLLAPDLEAVDLEVLLNFLLDQSRYVLKNNSDTASNYCLFKQWFNIFSEYLDFQGIDFKSQETIRKMVQFGIDHLEESESYSLFKQICQKIDEEAAEEGLVIGSHQVIEIWDDLFRDTERRKDAIEIAKLKSSKIQEKQQELKKALYWLDKAKEAVEEPLIIREEIHVLPIAEDEVVFHSGNICSICLNEENNQEIQISLINGLEYFLEGITAINFLRKYERSCFTESRGLLKLYDSRFDY
jgi:hypothetical protein